METSHHFIKKLEYYLNHDSDMTLDEGQKTKLIGEVERLQPYMMRMDGAFNYEVVDYLRNKFPILERFWDTYRSQEKEQEEESGKHEELDKILMNI
jgi:hypothetical protein